MTATTTLKPYIESAQIVVVFDDDPDTSYLEQEGWKDRLESYRNGNFHFVGVYAEARVRFATEIEGGWTQGAYVRTPGLWGVESDSASSYFAEIGKDEQITLAEMLAALNVEPPAEALPISYR